MYVCIVNLPIFQRNTPNILKCCEIWLCLWLSLLPFLIKVRYLSYEDQWESLKTGVQQLIIA